MYSQFGEDGIIQWLLHRVERSDRTFVEFGVEDYSESNTRFLVELDDWRGLAIDASDRHRRFLESQLAWRHTVVAETAFLTTTNLNDVIGSAGFRETSDLVSIDVDGVDYWMLEALEVVSPRLLIVEYNSLFGSDASVTVPYSPSFDRTEAHFSTLYFGASLAAITALARTKGYALVGSNQAGTNAFFVRRDVLGNVREETPGAVWRETRVRQARDRSRRADVHHWDKGSAVADQRLSARRCRAQARNNRRTTFRPMTKTVRNRMHEIAKSRMPLRMR